jgi:cytochrome c6
MKKLIVVALQLVTIAVFSFTTPAWAGDAANGAKIFTANCAACHMGGRNVVNSAKTLQKGDLQKYGIYDLEQIKYQVTKGKAAMPAFSNKLSAQEIEDVATYVLSQADKGW